MKNFHEVAGEKMNLEQYNDTERGEAALHRYKKKLKSQLS